MTDGVFTPTTSGTPQGGVVSPLLANVALHGLEKAVHNCHGKYEWERPELIRYAEAGQEIPMRLRLRTRRDQVRGTERAIAAMPAAQGVEVWPAEG